MTRALASCLAGLRRLNVPLLAACSAATVSLVAVITIVVAAGVFWRYVLNDALSWTEEVAKFSMLWLTFVGAPIALARGGHVAIELLPRSLPLRLRHLVLAFGLLIVVLVLVVFVWRGTTFAWNGRTQVAPTVGEISLAWVFAAIPVGSVATLLVALEQMLGHLLTGLDPERFTAPRPAGELAGAE